MCIFLGVRKNIDRLDKTVMKHIVSMFNLPKNTSYNRLRIIFGEPNIEYKLAIRLLKVYHKYKNHFQESSEIFKKLLNEYFDDSILSGVYDKAGYDSLAAGLVHDNLTEIFNKYYGEMGFKLRNNHRRFLMRVVYKGFNKKDFYFARYLANISRSTNMRLFPICDCGEPNKPGHASDKCELTLNEGSRKKYKSTLDRLYEKMGRCKLNSLHEYIVHSYFVLEHRDDEMLKKVFRKIRSLVFDCVTRSEQRA